MFCVRWWRDWIVGQKRNRNEAVQYRSLRLSIRIILYGTARRPLLYEGRWWKKLSAEMTLLRVSEVRVGDVKLTMIVVYAVVRFGDAEPRQLKTTSS